MPAAAKVLDRIQMNSNAKTNKIRSTRSIDLNQIFNLALNPQPPELWGETTKRSQLRHERAGVFASENPDKKDGEFFFAFVFFDGKPV